MTLVRILSLLADKTGLFFPALFSKIHISRNTAPISTGQNTDIGSISALQDDAIALFLCYLESVENSVIVGVFKRGSFSKNEQFYASKPEMIISFVFSSY